jgi:Fe(3+) dicitrate transport protein
MRRARRCARLAGCGAAAFVLAGGVTTARADDLPKTELEATTGTAVEAANASTPPAEPTPESRSSDTVEVRVIGDRADALQRVPGSGTVIGSKDLKRAAPVDAAEMLRRVPGVQVRQEFGGGNRLDISIRGVEGGRSRRVLVLEDGIPLSINPYSEPDMYYAPPIERYRGIEVVKGSGNILFGPQTLAGTINFLTLAPPERSTVALDVDAGTYGYTRVLGSYGDAVGKGDVRYVAQLLHRRGDGFRDLPFSSTNGLFKLAFPTGPRGDAVVKLGFHRDDAASDDVGLTSGMYARTPRRESLSPSSHLVLNRFDASVTHEQRLTSALKLRTLAYAYRTDRVWRRQDYVRAPAAGDPYESIVGDPAVPGGAIYFRSSNAILDRTYDVLGVEPRFEARFKTSFVGHTLDFGGRVLHETADYEQRTGTYKETYAGSLDFVERHAGTAFAAYVQDRIAFTDKLLVTPGIRLEHLGFERIVLRQASRDTFVRGDKAVTGLVPGIGIVYGTKEANVFGGMHRGYAPPRVTSSITARGETSAVAADQSMNYEIGTRGMPLRWLRGEAAGFVSNFDNQVIVQTAPGVDNVLTDAGATNIVGAESGVSVSIDRALSLPAIVELGARYTYARSTFRYGANAGNFLPYAPEHAVNTNLDVEHRSGAGGQIAYAVIGQQFADAENTRAEDVSGRIGLLEARHIVDATVHYRHARSGIAIRLTAKNLLDSTYIIARRPEGIFTGPYRQLLVGVRWEWEAPRE